jgi:hypothetical protein
MAMGCAGVLHNTTRRAGLCIPSDAPAAVNCCRRSCSSAVPGAAGARRQPGFYQNTSQRGRSEQNATTTVCSLPGFIATPA